MLEENAKMFVKGVENQGKHEEEYIQNSIDQLCKNFDDEVFQTKFNELWD